MADPTRAALRWRDLVRRIVQGGDYGGRFMVYPNGHIWTALPTVNPNVAGELWNDGGTMKVSAR